MPQDYLKQRMSENSEGSGKCHKSENCKGKIFKEMKRSNDVSPVAMFCMMLQKINWVLD